MSLREFSQDRKHHNTGRPQPLRTAFAGRVNYLNFQLRAAQSNLYSAVHQIISHPGYKRLTSADRQELAIQIGQLRELRSQMADIQKDLAEWNVNKKWIGE